MRNHYKVLEISDFADSEMIHSAYRRLAKLYHPDVNPHYKLAAEMFKLVNEAYEVLSNPQKKMAYDSLLRQENVKAKSCPPETDGDAAHWTAENIRSGFWDKAKWDVDDWFFAHLRRSGNAAGRDNNATTYRIHLFLRMVFFLDICLVGYFIYAMSALDLSIVPQANFVGYQYQYLIPIWPKQLKRCIVLQKLSIWIPLFWVSAPWLQRTSVFRSIFNLFTIRGWNPWFCIIVIYMIMKAVSTFYCIAPFFGMSLFDLPNGMMLCAFLWHFSSGVCLLVWFLDHFYKEEI
jgi:hypothetical protein